MRVQEILRRRKGKDLTSNATRTLAVDFSRASRPAAHKMSEIVPIDRYWISVGGTLTEVFTDEPTALVVALRLKESNMQLQIAVYDAIEREYVPVVFKDDGNDGTAK